MKDAKTRNNRCDYYSRFEAPYTGNDPKHWNTYHRSQKKSLVGVKQKEFTTKSYQNTKHDKTGCYHNPFFFSEYKDSIRVKKGKNTKKMSNIYDDLLKYQHQMASYFCDRVKKKQTIAKVNCDNQYPCVLVLFPKPDIASSDTDWVNWVSILYTAISLKLIDERGLNAEIVRRSGFGHIRPSIAETAPSLRINLGMVPKAYVDALADAVVLTEQLITDSPDVRFGVAIKTDRLKKDMIRYNKAKEKAKQKVAVSCPETLWDALWQRMDSKGHSFVYQIFRNEANVECTINRIFDLLREAKKPLTEILDSEKCMEDCFIAPFKILLQGYQLNNKNQFTINMTLDNLKKKRAWTNEAVLVNDDAFYAILQKLLKAFNASEIPNHHSLTLAGLHALIEKASRTLFFKPPEQECDDGYGSDSEEEDEIDLDYDEPVKIFAKKFITATGMRAIQLAVAAAKLCLEALYTLSFKKVLFFASTMYYETEEALKNHAIPLESTSINQQAKPMKLVMYDLNYCNTTHKRTQTLDAALNNSGPILVLDTTSATTEMLATIIRHVFATQEHITTIIAVSSGLKNEQGGSDINPYGTLRIFSTAEDELDIIYNSLIALDKAINYMHPKESHLLRKLAKALGFTPTNSKIIEQMKR